MDENSGEMKAVEVEDELFKMEDKMGRAGYAFLDGEKLV
jgi:hypothetical protein